MPSAVEIQGNALRVRIREGIGDAAARLLCEDASTGNNILDIIPGIILCRHRRTAGKLEGCGNEHALYAL